RRAGRGGGHVDVAPLRPGVREDRDALARFDAEVDQAEADLLHDLAELREADVMPLAVALEADGDAVAVLGDRLREHARDRLRARARCGGRYLHQLSPPDAYSRTRLMLEIRGLCGRSELRRGWARPGTCARRRSAARPARPGAARRRSRSRSGR